MTHEVIMPALGMAQETGLILAWRKRPGDAVKAGDVLMEVETDKAAMEVEAQEDGFLTEVRAAEGEEVPVGEVIALISKSADSVKDASSKHAPVAPVEADPDPNPATNQQPDPLPVSPNPLTQPEQQAQGQSVNGKLLASPKAKRLAKEQGLDLSRLASSGHPQPFRAADLEVLAALSQPGTDSAIGGGRLVARARVAAAPFDNFCAWIAKEKPVSTAMVLAVFAAGSLRTSTGKEGIGVLVNAPRKTAQFFAEAERTGLGLLEETANPEEADLLVYDLTGTRLTDAELATSLVPSVTVARDGEQLVVTLSAPSKQLDDDALITCLDALAGRLDEPLRHLL